MKFTPLHLKGHFVMACAMKSRSVSHGCPFFAECLAPFACLPENGRACARFARKFAMKFASLHLKGHFAMVCAVKSRSVSQGLPFFAECLASFACLHENERARARFARKFAMKFTHLDLKGQFAMACAMKSRSVSPWDDVWHTRVSASSLACVSLLP